MRAGGTLSPADPAGRRCLLALMATDPYRGDSYTDADRGPLRITPDDGVAATITVSGVDEVFVDVEIDSSHVALSIRDDLVEAIFAHPAVLNRSRIRASVPLGDTELLTAFARHCPDIRTRAAGATCLVDARR